MKNDIENRNDIEVLVNTFYNKVKKDDQISYFFTDVVPVNWEQHLPVMYDFWEGIVFNNSTYTGNPMSKHFSLHQRSPLEKSHFEQWMKLFSTTVDELYSGINADKIKQRALSIATVMRIKIAELPDGKLI